MSDKIIGYVLLACGIVIILAVLVNVYLLFLGTISPVGLFNFESVSIEASQLLGGDLDPSQRALIQQQLGNSSFDIIPSDVLNDTSNLIAHVVIMGLIATIGYRLGMLGVYMLRTIEIPIKNGSKTQKIQ